MIFKYNNTEFDTYSAKSKHFYSPLITNKAYHPKRFNTLLTDLEISNALQEVLSIPHNVASETYYYSFQYKLLNNILFKKTKLFKIDLFSQRRVPFAQRRLKPSLL